MSANGGGLRPALLNPCYWPEVRRGSERFAHDLGRGLAARGHSPTLITSHPGRPTDSEEDGMRVIRTWRPPAALLERRGFEHHLTHVPLASRALRRGDFQIAHPLYAADAQAALGVEEGHSRPGRSTRSWGCRYGATWSAAGAVFAWWPKPYRAPTVSWC